MFAQVYLFHNRLTELFEETQVGENGGGGQNFDLQVIDVNEAELGIVVLGFYGDQVGLFTWDRGRKSAR